MATNLYRPRTLALTKLAGLPRYNHPANLTAEYVKPVSLQLQQINGQLEFGKGLYHNSNYQQLVKNVTPLRALFRKTASLDARAQVASQEFSFWDQYLHKGVSEIPDARKISDTHRQQLFQVYTIAKERNEEAIACNRLLIFHNQYAKAFKMDIEIHPLILMKMVHPHFGYLTLYRNNITLQHLVNAYNQFIFASQEKYQGQSLHADELTAFIFWKMYTDKQHMTVTEFCEFLRCFKFNVEPHGFRDAFRYGLNRMEGELSSDHSIEQNLVRFDFFRDLFLERGL